MSIFQAIKDSVKESFLGEVKILEKIKQKIGYFGYNTDYDLFIKAFHLSPEKRDQIPNLLIDLTKRDLAKQFVIRNFQNIYPRKTKKDQLIFDSMVELQLSYTVKTTLSSWTDYTIQFSPDEPLFSWSKEYGVIKYQKPLVIVQNQKDIRILDEYWLVPITREEEELYLGLALLKIQAEYRGEYFGKSFLQEFTETSTKIRGEKEYLNKEYYIMSEVLAFKKKI